MSFPYPRGTRAPVYRFFARMSVCFLLLSYACGPDSEKASAPDENRKPFVEFTKMEPLETSPVDTVPVQPEPKEEEPAPVVKAEAKPAPAVAKESKPKRVTKAGSKKKAEKKAALQRAGQSAVVSGLRAMPGRDGALDSGALGGPQSSSRVGKSVRVGKGRVHQGRVHQGRVMARAAARRPDMRPSGHDRESYLHIQENDFISPKTKPLSTFSIDVDTASYSNMRRFITRGRLPPKDAVRIEEMLNYFTYDYEEPEGEHPIGFTSEVAVCPWNSDNRLVRLALQARSVSLEEQPPMNLVYLVDTSGSMSDDIRLLVSGLSELTQQMRPEDRVAIVAYAGSAGLALPSTSGEEKGAILMGLRNLRAGGSTAGGAGIQLAYTIAEQNFVEGGINRVILATDGDFNVGTSSHGDLIRLIEEKRKTGVFLSVLGFGRGNYRESALEALAQNGNGNYAYIDTLQEARRVLVERMGGTLNALAKDVKFQIEMNPEHVQAYRLIGYENRKLAAKDFNDDKKDAGEMGAGHSVTAIYEVVPHGVNTATGSTDPLRYQTGREPSAGNHAHELMRVKLRYKQPAGEVSKLVTYTVEETAAHESMSNAMLFASAVAEFGLLLRESKHRADASYAAVSQRVIDSLQENSKPERTEFLNLVQRASTMSRGAP